MLVNKSEKLVKSTKAYVIIEQKFLLEQIHSKDTIIRW